MTAAQFDTLYGLLRSRAQDLEDGVPGPSSGGAGSSIADLSRVVFNVIRPEQAEVITKLYRLLYLEEEVERVIEGA